MTDYADAVRDFREQQAKRARASILVTGDPRDDISKLSTESGLPYRLVERNPDKTRDLMERRRLTSYDFDALAKNSPRLTKMLADPNFATQAKDDIDHLSWYERLQVDLEAGVSRGNTTFRLGKLYDLKANQGGTLTPQQQAEEKALLDEVAFRQGDGEGAIGTAAEVVSSFVSYDKLRGAVSSAMAMGGASLAAGPGAPLAAPAATLAGFGAGFAAFSADEIARVEKGHIYNDLLKEGVDHGTANAVASVAALPIAALDMGGLWAIAAPIKRIALRKVLKQFDLGELTKPGAAMKFAQAYASAILVESGTEATQDVLAEVFKDIAREIQKPDHVSKLETSEGVGDLAATWWDTFAKMAPAMAIVGLPAPGINLVHDIGRAAGAQRDKAIMEALGDEAARSKLRERDPEAYRRVVEPLTKDGQIETIYINPDEFAGFFQSQGVDPQQVLMELGDNVLTQYNDALREKRDMAIPTALYAAKLAGTDYHAGLIDISKFDENGATPKEARAWMKDRKAVFEAEAERVLEQAKEREVVETDAQKVFDYAYQQRKATGASDLVAKTDAEFHRLRALVLSSQSKSGALPSTFYGLGEGQTPSLRVQNAEVAGPVPATMVAEEGVDYALSDGSAPAVPAGAVQSGGVQDVFVREGDPTPSAEIGEAGGTPRVKVVRTGTFRAGITRVESAEDVAHITAPLRKEPQESFLLVVTDNDGEVLRVIRDSIGTIDAAQVIPAHILGAAFDTPGAAKVWMVHQHPGGIADQSAADRALMSKFAQLLEGSGLHLQGSVVVAPGGGATFVDASGDPRASGDRAFTIPAKARDREIGVFQRRFRRVSHDGGAVDSPAVARATLDRFDGTGILLLDHRHHPVGWLPMAEDEMRRLRTRSTDTGLGAFLREISRGNAGALILKAENYEAVGNVAAAAKQVGVRVLDAIHPSDGRSMAERLGIPEPDTFYQDGQALFQSDETSLQEDRKWRNWKPKKTSTGKIPGAPEWVNRADDVDAAVRRMYRLLRNRIDEGMIGRYWYEDSARAVMALVDNDVVAAEKFIQLLAIYSPQAKVQVNTYFAVRAWNHWKNGGKAEDLKVKTGEQDQKAVAVLYNNEAFDGRKTNSFYLNLMHEIVAQPGALEKLKLDVDLVETLEKPATIDLWMYRAFGYELHAAGDDKGTGKYSFAENVLRRITARLNVELNPGEPRWTPHQVQAAIWSAMKARYEQAEVKEKTWTESIAKGYAFIDEEGKRRVPTEAAAKREHLKIWHKHAMAITSAEAQESAVVAAAHFGTFINQMTEIVTWEAMPSAAFGYDVFNASEEVKARFTALAKMLLIDDEGVDVLAERLGVPLAFVRDGRGAYEKHITPNNLSHLVPTKESGEFSRAEVQAYARAIQYIFKQDAVPWFRPDPLALNSKAAKDEQQFRVMNRQTGRMVPGSKGDLLSGAQELAAERNEKHRKTRKVRDQIADLEAKLAEAKTEEARLELEKELDLARNPFEVRGGKFARGVVFRFGRDLTAEDRGNLLQLLQGALGENVGFTQTAPSEVTLINFRDDRTGVPFMDDAVFVAAVDGIEDALQDIGVKDIGDLWSEGEYGYWHDWKADPEGQAVLETLATAGRSDLHAWLRDRRAAFEQLLEAFSGEGLQQQEEQVAQEALARQEAERLRQDTLAQGANDPRGGITFGDQDVISLFAKANLSTFHHESGHLFAEQLARLVASGDATDQAVADLETLFRWIGFTGTAQDWLATPIPERREMHETLARGWESYLHEGKAPTPELQGLFTRLRSWMVQIYRVLTRHNVELTDEVRAVYGRMVATEDAIANAQDTTQIFTSAEEAGMTEEQWAAYQAVKSKAEMQAEGEALRRIMADAARVIAADRKAMTDEVTAEVMARPVHQARYFLQRGYLYGQEPPEGVETVRLSRDALIEMYGDSPFSPVGMLPFGKWGVVAKSGEGVHPDVIAEQFGFPSGDALVQALLEAGNPKDEITSRVDAVIDERYSELRTPEQFAALATDVLHNDERLRVLSVEMKALASRAKKTATPYSEMRRIAKQTIAGKPVRLIKAWQYAQREAKARREAERAYQRGDFEGALKAKEAEGIQHALYMEARKAEESARKGVKYLKRFDSATVRKNVARTQLDQIDKLLERVSLRAASSTQLARRASLAEWIAEQEKQGFEVDLDPRLLDETLRQHYLDMTSEEFDGLVETVKSIEHLGRLKQRLIVAGEKRAFESVVDEMVDVSKASHDWKEPKKGEPDGKWKRVKQFFSQAWAEHLKAEFLFESLDGGENGIWWKAIFRPLAEAEAQEIERQEKAARDVRGIFDAYSKKERAQMYKRRRPIAGLNREMTKMQLLSLALNWGNEGNRTAVLNGVDAQRDGWTAEKVQAALDRELDKRDWDTVQALWDYIDTYWADIAELQYRLTGVRPKKVEAKVVATRHGDYKGGYYPLVYDPERSYKAFTREEKLSVDEALATNFLRPATRKGHTIERVGSGGQDVRLEIGVIAQHLTNVIHDLTHREAILQADRLITNPRVREAVEATAGQEVYRTLRPWLASIASSQRQPSSTMERMVGYLRRGGTVVNMGWKLTTAIVQPLGYLQSIEILGEKWAMRGLTKFYGSPKEMTRFIFDNSAMMRHRLQTFDRDINDTLRKIKGDDAPIQKSFFLHIGWMDMMVSLPTWVAGYDKALAEGKNHDTAVQMADKAVRMSQSAGGAKDLAGIQGGSDFKRMFTMFYSYFSVLHNLLRRRGEMAKRGGVSAGNITRTTMSVLYLVILPAVLSELIAGRGPDDDDEWDVWAAKTVGLYPLMSVVGARDIANGIMGEYGYEMTPVSSALNAIVRGARSVGDIGDDFTESDLKGIVTGLGYLTHLPARQVWISASNLYDVMEGETLTPAEWLMLQEHKK